MNFCMHCMEPLEDGAAFCPECGKAQSYDCPEHHLQPGTFLSGKTLYCEDVTARDGSTTRFYFDGDDLCYIDVDNGQMKINKLTGTVP
ncbi:MAG: zinc-ribbon domain-containing protein, partial [Clostridia bacterium]|nr:zinc-ribbon domain-containing protein [Clostridia bacterium]